MKYAYQRFSEILWKHYGSPGNHFSTTWRSLPLSCFLLKQPISKMSWKGLDSNCYLHLFFTKYTPLLFWLFFFRNVTKLYEFRNDTCFLSVRLRNLTSHVITPFLAFGMLQKLTDCVTILPFDFRYVTKFHGLCNKGCQVPRSGQTKVSCHQRMVPRRN